MSRILGVDLGSRRIGLALSDPSGTLASPLEVITRSGDPGRDRSKILDALRQAAPEHVTIDAYDERFTTVIAQRGLVESGMRRQARKQVVDKVAAAVMLQSYLDARA